MKIKFGIIIIIFLSFFSCTEAKKLPLNEIPMYNEDKISEYQKNINDKFIEEIKSLIKEKKTEYKNLKEVADHYMQVGWDFFVKKDYSMAIKRFNQAWLLDPTNPEIYWGFGNYLGVNENFEKSIIMLKKSIEMGSNNIKVYEDLAKSYNMNGFKKFSEGKNELLKPNLESAIDIIENAIKMKETGVLYHHWAVSLFYLEKYSEAYEKVKKAQELGDNVPDKFINDIKEKLR